MVNSFLKCQSHTAYEHWPPNAVLKSVRLQTKKVSQKHFNKQKSFSELSSSNTKFAFTPISLSSNVFKILIVVAEV